MYKNILIHENFMNCETKKINNQLDSLPSKLEIKRIQNKVIDLVNYHNQTVYNFQHERLIHLIITIFFAFLEIISVVGLILITFIPQNNINNLLTILITIIFTVLFITEVFYILHYYKLENGIQKLYKYSQILKDINIKCHIIDR